MPASSRLTINIEDEAPELANTAVSTRVETVDVSDRVGARDVLGHDRHRLARSAQQLRRHGSRPEVGPRGGTRRRRPRLSDLRARLQPVARRRRLRVTFIKEDGTAVVRTYTAAPQRLNIPAGDVPELANSNFSTIVESINGVPINVESAIYWNANGVIWEGGGNTVATPIP